MKKKVLPILISLLIGALFYYFMLPPINLSAPAFWGFLFILGVIYFITYSVYNVNITNNVITHRKTDLGKKSVTILISIFVLILVLIGVNIINSPLFNAKSYYDRITVNKDKSFEEDVKEVDFNALPLLDKESSQKLGDRVMGQMTELVSQFRVSSLYTQINYNDEIIRVTPLEYANFIKYFTNRKGGVKGYIKLNSINGKSELIKLEKGMKYMPSALFNENLFRKLRFMYPTEIFDRASFEIDNDGNPYWIVPTIKYSGIGLRRDIKNVIIFNPITGESKKYDVKDVPSWVDHVYPSELVIEQLNDWGLYEGGFFNSIFGQKGVVATTRGYNYTVMNDDVFLYTGITSVASDESNIGFVLTNLRTKETRFYAVSGAEEYSAMASAEGQVQQMKYRATFPLLINLNNKPTYLMSLKDNAGLVKMYAFVDVTDYQNVVVSDAKFGIEAAAKNYLGNDINNSNNSIIKDITISKINESVIDGTSYYYFVDNEGYKYSISIKVDSTVIPFLEVGSKINVSYNEKDSIREIVKINK
ncbi:MAG: CvpA family protein [Ignavibacteriales bacterium]